MRKISLMKSVLLTLIASTAIAQESPSTFTLETNAFLDKGILPVLYTCDGKDTSPELSWTGAPEKTAAFALILADPEAPGGTFYHWIIYDIGKSVATLPEGTTSATPGVKMGMNSWEKNQYSGPCPPKDTAHTYIFTLYALDKPLSLSSNATGKDVLAAMQNHVLGTVTLTTVYSRWIT